MILRILQETPFLRKIYFNKWGKAWVEKKLSHFIDFIRPEATLLDIGCGNGLVSYELMNKNFQVTSLDVEDLSFSDKVVTIVYDGIHIPFKDNEFEYGLLLTVLHHTSDPVRVLRESARVCRKLIIMEDIYYTSFQKQALYTVDAIVNLGYSDLNFTHKSDREWKEIFEKEGLKIYKEIHFKTLSVFNQVVYFAE